MILDGQLTTTNGDHIVSGTKISEEKTRGNSQKRLLI